MGFIGTFFVVLFGICIFAALLGGLVAGLGKEAEERLDRKTRELEASSSFWKVRSRGPVRTDETSAILPLVRDYVMMADDQRSLRFTTAQLEPETKLLRDRIIPLDEIVSAELELNSRTLMKLDVNLRSNKQGSLTRAAVGRAIFGPAGAIVGATSAGSRTTGVMEGESEIVDGDIYLVVGTTSLETPVVRTRLADRKSGEEWLHRIRGAMHLLASPLPI